MFGDHNNDGAGAPPAGDMNQPSGSGLPPHNDDQNQDAPHDDMQDNPSEEMHDNGEHDNMSMPAPTDDQADQDNQDGHDDQQQPEEHDQHGEQAEDHAEHAAQPDGDELLDIKHQALQQLSPLVGQLDQTAEEKFRTTMMMIQATDNHSLLKEAFEAAKQISDDKDRAQALLDVINEINYFTQPHDQ